MLRTKPYIRIAAISVALLALAAAGGYNGLLRQEVAYAGTGSISVGNASGDRTDTITVAVNLSGGAAVGSFGCDISWDSSYLTYVSTSKGSKIPSSGWTFMANTLSATSVRIGGYGVPDMDGSGTLATLKFQIKSTAAYGNTTVSIGNVTDGLSAGGNGTVTVQAGVKITSFTANPATISAGETSTLSWAIENATGAEINNGVGTVNKTSGTAGVSPTETTTYTLTADGPGGPKTAKYTVTVSKVPRPEIQSFTVDSNTVVSGEKVTFSFKISGADKAWIDPTVGTVNKTGGTATAKVTKDTTFVLSAKNAGGTVTESVNVKVIKNPIIQWFSSTADSKDPIYKGDKAYLGWSVVGADSVTISRGVGEVDEEAGITMLKPTSTTTYTLTAVNKAGTSSADATIYVTTMPVIKSFEAKPAAVIVGQAVNFHWTITGADTAEINPEIGSVRTGRGSRGFIPPGTETYTLTAANEAGTVSESITVKVYQDAPDLELTLESVRKTASHVTPADSGSLLGRGVVGEEVSLSVRVDNIGYGDADTFKLQLREPGRIIDEKTIGSLGAGNSKTVKFSYMPLQVGDNILEIVADPDYDVPEEDLNNNIISGVFEGEESEGVDLVISHVKILKSEIAGLTNVLTVSFRISNVGTKDSGSFEYVAYIRKRLNKLVKTDSLIVKGSVDNLIGGGDSFEVTKTVILKKIPSKFYFQGIVDLNEVVSEVNESNNKEEIQISKNDL